MVTRYGALVTAFGVALRSRRVRSPLRGALSLRRRAVPELCQPSWRPRQLRGRERGRRAQESARLAVVPLVFVLVDPELVIARQTRGDGAFARRKALRRARSVHHRLFTP